MGKKFLDLKQLVLIMIVHQSNSTIMKVNCTRHLTTLNEDANKKVIER